MHRRLSIVVLLVAAVVAGLRAGPQQGSGLPPGSRPPSPPPLAPGQAPPQTEGTGAISGVISDGDTHKPLAGAVVYLGIQGRGPVGRMSRQVTDAKGRFVFGNLPASDAFFMNVSKAGYNDGHYGDTGPVGSGVAAGLIRLTAGQWFSDANIPLWRPCAIAGMVLDERGEPVVGIHVRALARILVAGLPHLAASGVTRTDDRGRYRIAGLPAGAYVVSVPSVQTAVPISASALDIEGLTPESAARNAGSDTPRRNNGALDLDPNHLLIIGNYVTPPAPIGGQPQAYPMAFYPGVPGVTEAQAIELRNGESREGADIVLRPAPAVPVSGRIEAPPDATRGLVLRLIAAGMEDLAEGSEVATTLVGTGGEFTFLNVPAGDYTLTATRSMLEYSYGPARSLSSQELPGTPGLVPGPGTFLGGLGSGPPGTRVAGSHAAGDINYFARMPVSVGAAGVSNLSVVMRRAVSMHGVIAFDGNAAPGATAIIAEPADGRSALGIQQSTTRPAIGDDFAIDGLVPGEYMLRIVGLTPRHAVKSITMGGVDYSTRPFDASSGQNLDEVVITYTDQVAAIDGAVPADANGPRMMSVIAFPASREQWTRYGLTPSRFKSVPVSNAGTYKIENIPAGSYLLLAVDSAQSRRWQDPAFLDAAARIASRLTIGWGETKTQDLRLSVIK